MSFLTCSATITSGFSSPIVTTYRGLDGVLYNVRNRQNITIAYNLTLTAGLAPFIQTNWISGSGTVVGIGVILDSLGNEIAKFYPASIMTPAFSKAPIQVYYPSNPTTPFVAGDYSLLTFDLVLSTSAERTKGSVKICIGGTEITPTPTPTFVPTLTPTPTPVPPTPTPTATIVP